MRACDACLLHDGTESAPGRHAAPGPEPMLPAGVRLGLGFPDAMYQVKHIEKGWRGRDGTVDTTPALLEAFENSEVGGEVHLRTVQGLPIRTL